MRRLMVENLWVVALRAKAHWSVLSTEWVESQGNIFIFHWVTKLALWQDQRKATDQPCAPKKQVKKTMGGKSEEPWNACRVLMSDEHFIWIQASVLQLLLSMGYWVKPIQLIRLHAHSFDGKLQPHIRLGALASAHRRSIQCWGGGRILYFHKKRLAIWKVQYFQKGEQPLLSDQFLSRRITKNFAILSTPKQ